MSFSFALLRGGLCEPRLGRFHTPHGEVATPAFMPVATRGMLRGIAPDQLRPMGVEIVLANAFHLYVRPGVESVARLGGVHGMLAWDGPVLTDSGGFQVFSLSALCKVGRDGVEVEDPVRGGIVSWTPRLAFETQAALGPDVAMILDHCPSRPGDRQEVIGAVARTIRWAKIQRDLHDARGGSDSGQALFGIVQGGIWEDQRERCARELVDLEFDGYAVGGVSLGEGHEAMLQGVGFTTAHLPPERIRYLMGVGTPLDLVEAVALGVDLFDCVFPTRSGRFATALTQEGRLHLLNARFREDRSPIEPGCDCAACATGVPRGALRAGFKAKELLPPILVSLHNLHYVQQLMARMRAAIAAGSFGALRDEIARAYPQAQRVTGE